MQASMHSCRQDSPAGRDGTMARTCGHESYEARMSPVLQPAPEVTRFATHDISMQLVLVDAVVQQQNQGRHTAQVSLCCMLICAVLHS